jgi:cytoskeleton protein RodZ
VKDAVQDQEAASRPQPKKRSASKTTTSSANDSPGSAPASPVSPEETRPVGAARDVPVFLAAEEGTPPADNLNESPAESTDVTASQVVFSGIGAKLSHRRESLSLSLDEIERHTHIRRHYLEALEEGHFERLPSSVQTRGILNNYAHFLDLEVDALLLEYAGGLQAQLKERQPQPGTGPGSGQKPAHRSTFPAALRRILSPDILVGGGVLVLLVIFAIWGTGRIIHLSIAATPQPTAPSISNILLSSPVGGEPTFTSTAGLDASTVTVEAGPTLEITLPPAGEYPVQIVLVAARSAWVKVLVDNVVKFTGNVTPGTAYAYGAKTQIEIVTGDGSAISILYNQTNLGTLGAFGEVVDRIYTATAILIPTATYTPSPTTTLTPTVTPRPSATLRASSTPRPSATPPP